MLRKWNLRVLRTVRATIQQMPRHLSLKQNPKARNLKTMQRHSLSPKPKPSSRASWNLFIWQVNLPKNLIRFPQFLLLLSLSLLPRCAQHRLLTCNPLLQLLLNRWLRRISLSLKLPVLPQ